MYHVFETAFYYGKASVFTGSEDGLVKQWHAGNGDIMQTFSIGNPVAGLWGVGARLYVAGSTGTVSQYNLRTATKTTDYEVKPYNFCHSHMIRL